MPYGGQCSWSTTLVMDEILAWSGAQVLRNKTFGVGLLIVVAVI
ncbi:hypothetical protein [Mycobacterium uberis]|nr:hypothetical protein [Mycobacterium uberis]